MSLLSRRAAHPMNQVNYHRVQITTSYSESVYLKLYETIMKSPKLYIRSDLTNAQQYKLTERIIIMHLIKEVKTTGCLLLVMTNLCSLLAQYGLH